MTGGIDLSAGNFGGMSVGGQCTLRAPGRDALDLTGAEVGSSFVLDRGGVVQGTVRLSGTRIRGNLGLTGAELSDPKNESLVAAQGLTVGGDVALQALRAVGGQLDFRSAALGSVDAAGAQLVNPGGCTLNLDHATVKG